MSHTIDGILEPADKEHYHTLDEVNRVVISPKAVPALALAVSRDRNKQDKIKIMSKSKIKKGRARLR